ncbi:MAG: RecX family transcriptional regulator [Chloroflexia bacterium]|nr:RecX family transcriptional regulator [Chloroflexia bacterium]
MGGTITAIRVQKKNHRRVSLFLDGKFALGLSLEVVQDFGLRRGMELGDADLAALERAEQGRRAYQDALRLLSYRPRSVVEMRRRLAKKEYEEPQIEEVIERLLGLGLLDDLAFARLWVENRLALRPRGRRALENELRRKGVPGTMIQQALDESIDEGDERAMAFDLARGRAGSMAGLDREVFWRRLRGYLARRGFPAGLVYEVVGQVWQEMEPEEDPPA